MPNAAFGMPITGKLLVGFSEIFTTLSSERKEAALAQNITPTEFAFLPERASITA